jgi:O-antigen ligase
MQVGTARVIGRRRQPIKIWETREQCLTELVLFTLGAAGSYSISLVGMLPGNEILVFPLLPVLLLMHGRRAFRREYLWFYVLALAWLFGTIVGDLYRGSPSAQSIKGIARVVFFILDFITLAILINKSGRRMIIFLLSIFVQMALNIRSFQGEFLTQWKFGGSSIVTITALLFSCYFYSRRRYWAYFFIVSGVAVLNLVFAFRSQIATDFVSAALILPIFSQSKPIFSKIKELGRQPRPNHEFLKIVLLLALAGVAAFLADRAITFAANIGLFDESVTQKFQSQANGKFGVLVGGRPETLVAIQAIRDSPIIGHGSFAVDPKYIELRQKLQYEYGYSDTDMPDDSDDEGIPTHSHLTMAWVESGIFGGIFWIFVLVLTFRSIIKVSLTRPALAPIYSYLLLNFVWNVCYSPFGSVNRMWAAYFILLGYNIVGAGTPQASTARRSNALIPVRRPPTRVRVGLVG